MTANPTASRAAGIGARLGPRISSSHSGRTSVVMLLSAISVLMMDSGHGISTAAGAADLSKVELSKVDVPKVDVPKVDVPKVEAPNASEKSPVDLTGRWHGPRYVSMRTADVQNCGGKLCQLTYDIVACPGGWCGIVIPDAAPCGPIAVKLTAETGANRRNAFTGKLELAAGTAPYAVEAWYQPAGETAGEGNDQPHLNVVGDTGDGGMLMLRRSFPFQAELARIGDAQCTLDEATS